MLDVAAKMIAILAKKNAQFADIVYLLVPTANVSNDC